MNLDTCSRLVVISDTTAANNNIAGVIEQNRNINVMEEGELSDENDPAIHVGYSVTGTIIPDLVEDLSAKVSRKEEKVNKRNPWGGVAESWAAGMKRGELGEFRCLDVDEIKRVPVKDRLGWGWKERMNTFQEESGGGNIDWNLKMKRPRMAMVADMEERRMPVRNRLYGCNMAERRTGRKYDSNRLYKERGLEGMNDKDRMEAFNRKIGQPVGFPGLKDIVRRVNIGIGSFADGGKRTKKEADGAVRNERRLNGVKDYEDYLEQDNGSYLNYENETILIQVAQRVCESSDEEKKKLKKVIVKIEETNTRANSKIEKIHQIGVKKKRDDTEEENFIKKKCFEMRVREKIKSLKESEKKLLVEKARQMRIRKEKFKRNIKKSRSGEKSKTSYDSSDDYSTSDSDSDTSHSDDCTDSSNTDEEQLRTKLPFKHGRYFKPIKDQKLRNTVNEKPVKVKTLKKKKSKNDPLNRHARIK